MLEKNYFQTCLILIVVDLLIKVDLLKFLILLIINLEKFLMLILNQEEFQCQEILLLIIMNQEKFLYLKLIPLHNQEEFLSVENLLYNNLIQLELVPLDNLMLLSINHNQLLFQKEKFQQHMEIIIMFF